MSTFGRRTKKNYRPLCPGPCPIAFLAPLNSVQRNARNVRNNGVVGKKWAGQGCAIFR